jgi:hypothetical protein
MMTFIIPQVLLMQWIIFITKLYIMKNKLILTIEEQYYPETPFGKCADIIAYAVGTFNSDVDRTPYSTGKDNWKEYLMQFIRINKDAFDVPLEDRTEMIHSCNACGVVSRGNSQGILVSSI